MRVLIRIHQFKSTYFKHQTYFWVTNRCFKYMYLIFTYKEFYTPYPTMFLLWFFKVKWMLAYSLRNISHKYSNSAVDRLKIECLPSSAYTTFAGTSQLLAHFGHYNVYFMSREDLTIVSCFLFPILVSWLFFLQHSLHQ